MKEGVRWVGEEGEVERGEGGGGIQLAFKPIYEIGVEEILALLPHSYIVPMCCILGYNDFDFFLKTLPDQKWML